MFFGCVGDRGDPAATAYVPLRLLCLESCAPAFCDWPPTLLPTASADTVACDPIWAEVGTAVTVDPNVMPGGVICTAPVRRNLALVVSSFDTKVTIRSCGHDISLGEYCCFHRSQFSLQRWGSCNRHKYRSTVQRACVVNGVPPVTPRTSKGRSPIATMSTVLDR